LEKLRVSLLDPQFLCPAGLPCQAHQVRHFPGRLDAGAFFHAAGHINPLGVQLPQGLRNIPRIQAAR
jgi:hypothetical protein